MKKNYRITRQVYVRVAVLLVVFAILIANVLGIYYVDLDLGLRVEPSAMHSAFGEEGNAFLQALTSSVFFTDIIKIIPACFALCLALPFLSPIKASIATLTVAVYTLYVGIHSAQQDSYLLLEFGLLSVAIIFSVHVLSSFFTEYHDKQKLSNIFSQYIPPELVRAYTASSYINDLDGVSRELSVLFCDIQKFTTLSEGMEPRSLAKLLNAFLTDITQIILKHNGTIDKYMGDSVMAFWGAPIPDEQHARHAYTAAVEIQDQMRVLRAQFKSMGLPEIYCGVGVNTGVCSVGNMGSEFRIAYTAIGDTVNVASRLERLTRQYRVPIVIAEATLAKIPDVICRELDIVKVKGHTKHIKVYDPLKVANVDEHEIQKELAYYQEGLTEYRQRNWDQAWKIFNELHSQHPQVHLYKLYKESIHYYESHQPPDDWPGMIADPKLIRAS